MEYVRPEQNVRNASNVFVRLHLCLTCDGTAAYLCLAMLLTMIARKTTGYVVGRLRPHFIDVCKPNVDMMNCTLHSYIIEYKCLGDSEELIRNARLSFFSEHAALALTAGAYIVVYLQIRLPRMMCGLSPLPLLQLAVICCAFLLGFTTLSDHSNHWSDVLVGYIVGGLSGFVVATHLAQLRQKSYLPVAANADLPYIDDSGQGNDSVPRYKTSVVRLQPTELRIFE
ncbi:hypothetical protein AB6A40_003669 [Gnathostoma spinigerum]|uniref:Phosphatidic acid phosphatase type 2/haloperoxidase domain-containing protein n=1 Tax=Gnathostoma spinigerum TaxID=75299 RepID=A0ABD6EBE2_9BILA